MHNRLFLTIVIILGLNTFRCQAQDNLFQSVSIEQPTGTIENYLHSIEDNTSVRFVYSDVIQPDRIIDVVPGQYAVGQLLDSLFKEQHILYVNRENLIILSPQSSNALFGDRFIIEGQVTNRKREGIPFATVYIENKSVGTITNADGAFRVVLAEEYVNDTLTIGSLGYEDQRIPPNRYLTGKVHVKLKTDRIAIKDVVIRPDNPDFLVRQSYKKREYNYRDYPIWMNAFFRESSKQDDDYIAISEALVQINKASYKNQKTDQIKLLRGRNGTNIGETELVNLVVEGGLVNGLKLDIAKYGSYFYGENSEREYTYKLDKTIMLKGRQTYKISFKAKDGITYPGYEGKLYIDAETLALSRVEFQLTDEGIRLSRSLLVKKTPRKFRAKPVYANYIVDYRFYDGVWNLNSAMSDFGIKVKKVRGKENKGYSCDFTSTSEFVITSISDTAVKRIPMRETVRSDERLVEQVENTTATFWVDDNIILPEEPLLSTIQKLQEQGALPREDSLITKEK